MRRVILPIFREVCPEKSSIAVQSVIKRRIDEWTQNTAGHNINMGIKDEISNLYKGFRSISIISKDHRSPNSKTVFTDICNGFKIILNRDAQVYILVHRFQGFFVDGFDSNQYPDTPALLHIFKGFVVLIDIERCKTEPVLVNSSFNHSLKKVSGTLIGFFAMPIKIFIR